MDKHTDEMYKNITNQDLITITINCLEEIQNRMNLQDYLTEMTYDPVEDRYEAIYTEKSFSNVITDLRKYLQSKMYKIQQNKEETR